MNTLVNFEIAKLLKEKGWDINTYSNCWVETLDGDIIHNKDRKNIPEHDRCEQYLMQPTIAEVVMWLYEKHRIWINVKINGIEKTFTYSIHNIKTMQGCLSSIEIAGYNSPTEAYSAAIEYTLKNLI